MVHIHAIAQEEASRGEDGDKINRRKGDTAPESRLLATSVWHGIPCVRGGKSPHYAPTSAAEATAPRRSSSRLPLLDRRPRGLISTCPRKAFVEQTLPRLNQPGFSERP